MVGINKSTNVYIQIWLFYSYRNESTALIRAAGNVWTLTVNSEMSNIRIVVYCACDIRRWPDKLLHSFGHAVNVQEKFLRKEK